METFKLIFLIVLFLTYSNAKENKTCVYINSYHKGFVWSDKISAEIHNGLEKKCEVIEFFMDSKRNKDAEYIEQKALEAKELIEKENPSLVIISDDNAAKYLVKPYYRESKIPFLFCGINWTAKEYEFPPHNVKGMIEVLPVKSILKLAVELSPGKHGIFIGDDTLTDKKDFSYFRKYAKRENIQLDSKHVFTVEEWEEVYKKAQSQYDFIILGHNSAIKGWDDKRIKKFLDKNSKVLSFSTYTWMLPFSMIGNVIKAEEQGQWVTQSAKAILDGYDIKNISITINKTWNSYINYDLIKYSKVNLPRELRNKFKKYDME